MSAKHCYDPLIHNHARMCPPPVLRTTQCTHPLHRTQHLSNIMIPSELRSHWAKSWPKWTISSLRLIRLDNLEPTHGSRNSYDRIIHLSRTFAYHTVRVTYIPSFLWNHEYTTNDINTTNMADPFPCPPSDRPCARGHIRRLSSVWAEPSLFSLRRMGPKIM